VGVGVEDGLGEGLPAATARGTFSAESRDADASAVGVADAAEVRTSAAPSAARAIRLTRIAP
jgi:hypothetical protein